MYVFPIITSLLEQDAYKFSMGQCIFHQFNNDKTTWSFKCRNKNVKFTKNMVDEIKCHIDHFCTLKFTKDELEYLRGIKWIHDDYVDFLSDWTPHREDILINEGGIKPYNDCGLAIEARGPWLRTSMYEIPILAIVNEVYFKHIYGLDKMDNEFQLRTVDHFNKINMKSNRIVGTFSEFGLRRRYSKRMQDWLIGYIVDDLNVPEFVGTSNVYLAKKYEVKPVGTMAHEFIMTVGQGHHEYNPAYSNKFALNAWIKEYGVLNGIALTDTITTDCFLKDFQLTFATLFSGVRHDSGDPIEFGEKMIKHYEKLGIDPKTKTLLFSDSLNFDKAIEIRNHFFSRVKVAFGIGTFLSNPLDNPLNIVMKVTEANGLPVAKLSDVEGKSMCKDENYVKYLRKCIDWRMAN